MTLPFPRLLRLLALGGLLVGGRTGLRAVADHFVVLGSGGVPSAQEASILEVAEFWTEEFRRAYAGSQLSVLFGAGNQPGKMPFYADVRVERETKEGRSGDVLEHEGLEPGRLRGNQTATPAALKSVLGQHLRRPGQVWLFAHGHGSPNHELPEFAPDRYRDNRLLLWSAEAAWRQELSEPAPFTVPELRRLLTAPGRAADFIFLITSCYSGGFHQAVVEETDGRPTILRGAAGFSAAHEDVPSAGCTTTPDIWDDTYVGLFARQLMTDHSRRKGGRVSLTEAHRAAVLALPEWSFELPLATSDYYLELWAKTLFSSHPAHRALWGNRLDEAKAAFAAAWRNPTEGGSPAWQEHRRWVEEVITHTPDLAQPRRRDALNDPTTARAMLEELNQRQKVATRLGEDAEGLLGQAKPALLRAWNEVLPRLIAALPRSKTLTAELAWEPEVVATEAADPDPVRWSDVMLDRHSHLAVAEPARFAALTRWLARRANLRDDWIVDVHAGKTDADPGTVVALSEWRNRTIQQVEADAVAQKAETAWANFRRAVVYRDVSAAWQTLERLGQTAALADLAELHRIESLRLPPRGRK
jgi:hypothetical protein